MANVSVDVLRNSPMYKRVPKEEIPEVECYRDLSGNVLFVGKDSNGNDRVLDGYVTLRDVNGIILVAMRECGMGKRIRNIFEGVASILVLIGSPKIRAILSLVDLDYGMVSDEVEKLGKIADSDKVRQLVSAFGAEESEAVRQAVVDALNDGVLSPEEWSKIQALAASARR